MTQDTIPAPAEDTAFAGSLIDTAPTAPAEKTRLTYFLFLDTETTGLLASNPYMLEVAAIFCDAEFNEIDSYATVIATHDYALANLHPAVQEMHTANRLLAEIEADAGESLHLAEATLLYMWREILETINLEMTDVTLQLAGYSVHFDLEMLRRWMPALARKLHYRVLDVSSARTLLEPDAERTEIAHRAMADCRHALETARRYRKLALTARDTAPPTVRDGSAA